MTDDQTPSFHYGTHYSSAHIVTSYLIRLQPYVRSYLLLQGNTFDHADRLFHSIENAWASASCNSMTDVRELTPEFYYLPDFLLNSNGYDFGTRSDGLERVGDVKLPPWANGDPEIFIAKHRQALESSHVTQNLHHWIDLVFGFKQRGAAAIEATNVFHHLSYPGAKDLDSIEDPLERNATIGIIHSFGQTPLQVFNRPHDRHKAIQMDNFEVKDEPPRKISREKGSSCFLFAYTNWPDDKSIVSLHISKDMLRPVCSRFGEILIPPDFDIVLKYGLDDGTTRFYSYDGRKVSFSRIRVTLSNQLVTRPV